MRRTKRSAGPGARRIALLVGCVVAAVVATVGATARADADAAAERLVARGRAFEARGEPRHAAEAYRAALMRQPGLDRVHARLRAIHEAIGPADSAEQRRRLAEQFDDGTYLKQTRHFLIIYDGRHHWVDARAKLLEQAYANFMTRMRAAGFRPLPPAERLEVVLFARHRDFRDYTDRRKHEAGEWSAGYYTAGANRVIMFNFHTSPQLASLVERIDTMRREIDNLRALSRIKPARRRQLAHVQRKLGAVQQRYHTIAAWGNIRQTLHEAAHQLAYNTGIQRRGVQYPMWFSEGLATAFETAHPAAPFGPGEINKARLRGVFEARRRGELMPLEQLVGLRQPPDQEHPRRAGYSQSWALWHYLFKERPDALRRYVRRMADQRPGERPAEAHRADFRRCFGPLDEVETRWRDYLSRMLR